jgi:nitroreductase
MDVKTAIEKRRAYRSLDEIPIDEELINDLASSAALSPSCFNKQPWRFVFVYEPSALSEFKTVLNKGNEWAHFASMILAVITKKESDCIIKNREYAMYDTGMATAFLVLRATELGLVAHPIAGYDEQKAKDMLGVPQDMTLIALLIVGKKRQEIRKELSEGQRTSEDQRPPRMANADFAYKNKYGVN